MSANMARGSELPLAEMLADPIVLAVMARDGVTPRQVKALLRSVRGRIGPRRRTQGEIGSHSAR